MAKKNTKVSYMGKTKRSTDDMIDSAIAQQNSWMEQRRSFARRFLKTLNIFARPAPKADSSSLQKEYMSASETRQRKNKLSSYWFPILCALVVIFIAIWVAFVRSSAPSSKIVPVVPEPVIQKADIQEEILPTFDIVRIEKTGSIVVAGRWKANQNVSIFINNKIVATERTNKDGEFVYAPVKALSTGNYTISLMGMPGEIKSEENVFVYISPLGYKNSVSLLMTEKGSTLLQGPSMLTDGDLSVSKIDYLDTGRIVVTGDALPRLRVSLTLNDKYLGYARVSDHKHFGLGADVGKLESGKQYRLTVRLHDGDGRTVADITHRFEMPKPTGKDDTYYTVRRGDCLWIISRNFLRKGILFSVIAEKNNIENPDLIFPKQVLQIPVGTNK